VDIQAGASDEVTSGKRPHPRRAASPNSRAFEIIDKNGFVSQNSAFKWGQTTFFAVGSDRPPPTSTAMPRRARLTLADVPLHIIQRGNNRQDCFFAEEDYRFYLDCLEEYATASGCAVHAYVLMTNHVHLLVTPSGAESAGRMMKRLGQRYVQYVNRSYRRSGTLWEGRYRSCLVQEEAYLLACARYIELNPLRAGMVDHPSDYRWSSYRANAEGERDTLVVPHRLYRVLGSRSETRQAAYRALFRDDPAPAFLADIRRATNGNFALGDRGFQTRVASALGRRVTPGKPGRPRRKKVSSWGGLFGAN
jgi:putative transposase